MSSSLRAAVAITNKNLVNTGEVENSKLVGTGWVWTLCVGCMTQLKNETKGAERLPGKVVPVPPLTIGSDKQSIV